MKFLNDFFIPKQKTSATQSPDNQIETNRMASETLDKTGLPMDDFEGKNCIHNFHIITSI